MAIDRSFARRPSEPIHLDGADCAFAASRSNSSSPAIKDRERPSSEFVHREPAREHFQWWIETPSQRMRKPLPSRHPSVDRRLVMSSPVPGRCRQAAIRALPWVSDPQPPGRERAVLKRTLSRQPSALSATPAGYRRKRACNFLNPTTGLPPVGGPLERGKAQLEEVTARVLGGAQTRTHAALTTSRNAPAWLGIGRRAPWRGRCGRRCCPGCDERRADPDQRCGFQRRRAGRNKPVSTTVSGSCPGSRRPRPACNQPRRRRRQPGRCLQPLRPTLSHAAKPAAAAPATSLTVAPVLPEATAAPAAGRRAPRTPPGDFAFT